MIVKNDFLNKLKDFGLNSYETKIWCALLSRGISTAGELSDIANVPRSRSYDVLDSLEKKGFIITKLGKPFKYLAVPPNEVIERVKKNIKDDAQKSVDTLDKFKQSDILEELNLLHSKGVESIDPTELSGYIKSRDAIHNHLSQMINNAKENIIIACSGNGLIKKLKTLNESFINAKERGVNIRLLLPLEDKILLSKFKELNENVQIKFSKNVSHRFAAADNKQLLLMLQDFNEVHPLYDNAVWITSEYFVNSLVHFFDNTWNSL